MDLFARDPLDPFAHPVALWHVLERGDTLFRALTDTDPRAAALNVMTDLSRDDLAAMVLAHLSDAHTPHWRELAAKSRQEARA